MALADIQWFNDPMPTTDEEINGVENNLGHTFPADYREFAQLHSGGEPSHTDFTFPDGANTFYGSIGVFLNFKPDDPYSIVQTVNITEFFPDGLVPFAEGGGGDLVCFDYRQTETPSVVFWHSGRRGLSDEISFVAKTFTDFINTLEEPDDDENEE